MMDEADAPASTDAKNLISQLPLRRRAAIYLSGTAMLIPAGFFFVAGVSAAAIRATLARMAPDSFIEAYFGLMWILPCLCALLATMVRTSVAEGRPEAAKWRRSTAAMLCVVYAGWMDWSTDPGRDTYGKGQVEAAYAMDAKASRESPANAPFDWSKGAVAAMFASECGDACVPSELKGEPSASKVRRSKRSAALEMAKLRNGARFTFMIFAGAVAACLAEIALGWMWVAAAAIAARIAIRRGDASPVGVKQALVRAWDWLSAPVAKAKAQIEIRAVADPEDRARLEKEALASASKRSKAAGNRGARL